MLAAQKIRATTCLDLPAIDLHISSVDQITRIPSLEEWVMQHLIRAHRVDMISNRNMKECIQKDHNPPLT
ncbi:hypothetical protein QQP08_025682 [Theobroma cacao]|nr:hypothetical protein QQP08_025682 [Theobroma cacao]